MTGAAAAGLAALVDRTLVQGFRWLRFPHQLEDLFERETGAARVRHLLVSVLVATVVFDVFLLTDYFIVPDIFYPSLVVRLGVMTPIGALILFILRRGLPVSLREGILALLTVGVSGTILALSWLSHSPNAPLYQTSLMLVLMFGNVILRIRFWYAVVCSLATTLVYLLFAALVAHEPGAIMLYNVLLLVAAVVFTLFANYTQEQDHRRTYLLALRERLRRADLTERNAELSVLSHLDPLTGLANRRELHRYLDQLRQSPLPTALGIVMLDIDHFKPYNDHYGHPAGDECLRRVSASLRQALRYNGDMLARFGGEEFVVVLPGAGPAATRAIAERMRLAVQELAIPHAASPFSAVVTLSAGVATARLAVGGDPQTLINLADDALYRAKSAGRNCVHD